MQFFRDGFTVFELTSQPLKSFSSLITVSPLVPAHRLHSGISVGKGERIKCLTDGEIRAPGKVAYFSEV